MNKQTIPIKDETNKELGMNIGRPCCGSRTMCLSGSGESTKSKFVTHREFKGWHCSVNWFFLHLEQHSNSVFHHQTCQAKFNQTRGPIGSLDDAEQILQELEFNLKNNSMPTILCPKQTCGCGLCAPKSTTVENYKKVLSNHVDMSVFNSL